MKKIEFKHVFLALAAVVIVIITATMIRDSQKEAAIANIRKTVDTTNFVDTTLADDKEDKHLDPEQAYLDKLSETEKKAKLKVLKSRFIFENDEFRDIGFYYHKHWGKGWPDKKALYTYLNSKGFIFLVSNYYSDDWIFHTSVKVLVGSDKYETETVETYNELHKTEVAAGSVYENVTYTESPEIIAAIANNVDKKVKCRLEGRQYYSEFTLSAKDKQAIKDCYDLSYLIKQE